jgi:hypothetical protein
MRQHFPMREFASMTGRDFPVDGNISVSISSTQPNSPVAPTGAAKRKPRPAFAAERGS